MHRCWSNNDTRRHYLVKVTHAYTIAIRVVLTLLLATRHQPPDMIRFVRTAKTILAPALDRCRSFRRDVTRILGASAASAQATPRGISRYRKRYCCFRLGHRGVG